jgi:c-di-GMP-binding flagellar brake protein YcgR
MGMTTPFPEPDSPELRRFVVQSRAEIVGLLRGVQDRGVPMNVFIDVSSAFGVLALLRVDEGAGALVFASPADASLPPRLIEAPSLTFVGFVDAVKLQFEASGAAASNHLGRATVTVPIPAELIRLQRRAAARVRPAAARGAVCRVPLGGSPGQHEALRVLDISTGGLAVLAYPERFEPVVGAQIDGCRLDLPGVGGTVVSLRVRHVGPLPTDVSARCCGCEFVHMAPALRTMLERYIALTEETAG